MTEDYGANFVTIIDDEGNEIELEHLDTIEYQGQTYLSFFPTEAEGEETPEDEQGLIILKQITENGEDFLSTLDSEEELEAVYEQFMESLYVDDEDDD